MNKAHILIVEDEALLYKRMKTVLLKEHYSVSNYTPSVPEAIHAIQEKKPDIVLLDIDLQGDLTGLDLGKELLENYHIPFIYITDFGDDQTFYKGLETQHEHFIVKTKPRLEPQTIIRAIQTVLKKKEKAVTFITNTGVMGTIDYLKEIKNKGQNTITKIPISYKDIAYFTTDTYKNSEGKVTEVKTNYIRFITKTDQQLFLKVSIKELEKKLPIDFVRINESTIINIAAPFFDGRINGTYLSIFNQKFMISSTYKSNVETLIKNRFLNFH